MASELKCVHCGELLKDGEEVFFSDRGTLRGKRLTERTQRSPWHRHCYNISINSSDAIMEEIRYLSENIDE